MADLFVSRSFHCLWLPSPNFTPKPSKSLQFSSSIQKLPKRCSTFSSTHHKHMHANSTSSSTSIPEEDLHIISSTQHSDGSFVFRFGNASEIRENLDELELQRLVPEGVDVVEEAGVRVLLSDGVEDLNSGVDQNLVEEIESSSLVLVGVADQNPNILVSEKESVFIHSDPQTPVINDSEKNDRLLKLDSVEDGDGQYGILSKDVIIESNVVPSVFEEESQADHEEAVFSTDSPASDVFSDLSVGASGSAGVKEKEVDKGHGVDANSLTGGVDAQFTELVVVSTSLESRPSVDTATNNLIGSVDSDNCELVPVSTSLESVRVDYSATNSLQGGADVDIGESVPGLTSLESEHSADGTTNNPTGSADVDISELVPELTSLESELSSDGTTNNPTGSADVDISELVPELTSLESELSSDGTTNNPTGSADVDISELVPVLTSLESESSSDGTTNNPTGSADVDISEMVPVSSFLESEEVDNSATDDLTGSADVDISELVPATTLLESEEVENSATDDLTGSADADITELVPVTTSLESEQSVNGATNNLTVSADVDISGLVPASTSLDSEEVDKSATDNLTGSADADIRDLVPLSTSLESEPFVDGATKNLTGSATVDMSELLPELTSLESEEVDNSVTDGLIGSAVDDISQLVPVSTPLESEKSVNGASSHLIAGADAELSELVPVSTTLEYEQVDYSSTDSVTSGVDSDLIELAPESTSFESELHANDEETNHSIVDDSVDASKIGKSTMLHNLVPSSDFENKTNVGNTEGSGYENPSHITLPKIHSVEMASHGEETSRMELFLVSGAACLPHPSKALTGREDAYFISRQNWLAVVDGVGQWSFEGSNTGLYISELMEKCENIVSNYENISTIKPAEVLARSATETQTPGSSSALVAYFDGEALHAANVGNTGFIIIRDGSIFKKSNAKFHEFSFPLHLVKGDDHSETMEEYKIDLHDGDVIIFATNGLFDNLYEKEIASTISKSLQASLRPQEIAESLAMRAQEVGRSTSTRSPFGDAAQAVGYVGYTGGKLDDVTVIVSLVQIR